MASNVEMGGVQTRQERDALWSSIDTEEYPIGSILKYEFIATLREGTYGKVYRGREKASGKVVAIKRLKISRGSCLEIQLMRRIKMENIVQLFDVCKKPPWPQHSHTGASGDPGRKLYIVMEYCGGQDLCDVLNGSQPTRLFEPKTGKVGRFMHSVFRAIAYLHRNHIAHLDIKPENVLVSDAGEAKLIDFGLALELDPETGEAPSLQDMRGTCGYMPPEMILGEHGHPNVKAADIWAAGSVMSDLYYAGFLSQCQQMEAYLARISVLCGSIDERSLPGVLQLQGPDYLPLPRHCSRTLKDELRPYVEGDLAALDLLDRIFVLDPAKRISAHQALQHEYFSVFWHESQPSPLPATAAEHNATEHTEHNATEHTEHNATLTDEEKTTH